MVSATTSLLNLLPTLALIGLALMGMEGVPVSTALTRKQFRL